MSLSNKQTRHLRSLAHHLKPVVWVGQHGLSENVFEEIRIALEAHELIKVKLAAEKAERAVMIEQIVAQTHAAFVQHIGQMVVLFRRNEDKPRIVLPSQ